MSAPSSYLSGTSLAPVTFFGIAFGFRLICIGSPFIGSGLSSSLRMSLNSVVNSWDSMVVQKQNSLLLFRIVLGNPCGIRLNSFRCFIPHSISSSKSELTSTSILPFCHADVSSRLIFPLTCILCPVAVSSRGMFV